MREGGEMFDMDHTAATHTHRVSEQLFRCSTAKALHLPGSVTRSA